MAQIPLDNDYFIALGKFINAFTQAERSLHHTFHWFAQIPPEVANAIKRESNAAAVATMIRNVLAVNGFSEELAEDVKACISQFRTISDFRNSTIHRGASATGTGTYQSTNHATIKSLESLEISTFTIKNMKDATLDLGCITLRMFDRADGEHSTRDPKETEFLFAPWRYKYVEPDKPHQPARPAKKASPHRRQSSPP